MRWPRLRRRLTLGLLLLLVGLWGWVRLAPDDPARWHVDPAGIALRGTPNEYLAAPPGVTAATPHLLIAPFAEPPAALLARLAGVMAARPRTRLLAGDPAEGMMTWVERSALIGFPDYITARAIATREGTALVLWSRSRWGYGDFGVNAGRIAAILAALARE